MIFDYGQGSYRSSDREGLKPIEGLVTLGEHRVYLRQGSEDFTVTYVPLEKVEEIHLGGNTLTLFVSPTISIKYAAQFTGEKKRVKELAQDIVKRRGFKKRFLKNQWYKINH